MLEEVDEESPLSVEVEPVPPPPPQDLPLTKAPLGKPNRSRIFSVFPTRAKTDTLRSYSLSAQKANLISTSSTDLSSSTTTLSKQPLPIRQKTSSTLTAPP